MGGDPPLSLTRDAFASPPGLVSSTVLPWWIYALVLRGRPPRPRHSALNAVPRLLVCGLVAAIYHDGPDGVDLNNDGVYRQASPACWSPTHWATSAAA